MSDDDFMQASDEEYDFEYEDEDDEDSGDVDIENKYYNAKQMKTSEPEEAIEEFLAIPALEQEKSEWGFKGLKQAIKLEFKLEQYAKVRPHRAGRTRELEADSHRRQQSTTSSCSRTSSRP